MIYASPMPKRLILIAASLLVVFTGSLACTSKKTSDVTTGDSSSPSETKSKDGPGPGGTTEGTTDGGGDFCDAMAIVADVIGEGEDIDGFEENQEFWLDRGPESIDALNDALDDPPTGIEPDLETMVEGFEVAVDSYDTAADEDEFDQLLEDNLPAGFEDAVKSVSDVADEECGTPLIDSGSTGTTAPRRSR